MKDILISMILPVYNGEKFIERSIYSVLNQTHSNIELLVINDGSNDRTEDIVVRLSNRDSRIKHIKIENSGVSFARNTGLKQATGKYVGFIDADDYIDYRMIEILLEKAEGYDCDLVSCIYERKFPGKEIEEEVELKPGFYDKEDLEKHVYPNLFGDKNTKNRLPLNVVTKLFRNEIIKEFEIKFKKDVKFGEDLLFTRRFLLQSDSFYFISDLSLYYYIYNETSATSDYYPNKWFELKKSILVRQEIVDEYPQYKLEEEFSYSVVNSGINAVLNIFKNKTLNKADALNELNQIVEDEYVETALKKIDFKRLSKKDKILAYLIKWKKTKVIYKLLMLNNYLKPRVESAV